MRHECTGFGNETRIAQTGENARPPVEALPPVAPGGLTCKPVPENAQACPITKYNPRWVPMTKNKLPPVLVNREGLLLCSECKQPFVATETLSVSRAFAQHVRTMHAPKLPAKDASSPAKPKGT